MSSVRSLPSSPSAYAAVAYAILASVSTAIALIRVPCSSVMLAETGVDRPAGAPPAPSSTVTMPSRVATYSLRPSASTASASVGRGLVTEPSRPVISRTVRPGRSPPSLPLIVRMKTSSSILVAFFRYHASSQSAVPLTSCASTYAVPSRALAATASMRVSPSSPILWVCTAENPSLAFRTDTTGAGPGAAAGSDPGAETYSSPRVASIAASRAPAPTASRWAMSCGTGDPISRSAPAPASDRAGGSPNAPVVGYEHFAGVSHAPLPAPRSPTMTTMLFEPDSEEADPGCGRARLAGLRATSVIVPPLSRSAFSST